MDCLPKSGLPSCSPRGTATKLQDHPTPAQCPGAHAIVPAQTSHNPARVTKALVHTSSVCHQHGLFLSVHDYTLLLLGSHPTCDCRCRFAGLIQPRSIGLSCRRAACAACVPHPFTSLFCAAVCAGTGWQNGRTRRGFFNGSSHRSCGHQYRGRAGRAGWGPRKGVEDGQSALHLPVCHTREDLPLM